MYDLSNCGLTIFHKNTLKNCSIALQAFSFLSLSLSLSLSLFVSFISFFIKTRILLQFFSQFLNVCNSSRIPHPSVQPLVYVFLTFFRFYKFSNNLHLSKNLLRKKCFHWRLCFFIFLLPCCQKLAVYLWSEIISCD